MCQDLPGWCVTIGIRHSSSVQPGQPIRYSVTTDGEIDLDLNDEKYQWYADLPNVNE